MSAGYWTAPRLFDGGVVHILGGGPSLLKTYNPDAPGYYIACNNAYQLRPSAEVLLWADVEWLDWHIDKLYIHTGMKVSIRKTTVAHRIRHNRKIGFSTSPDCISGACCGGMAINLAAVMGAKTICLHGFDMRPGNWHSDHKRPPENSPYDQFIEAIGRMVAPLQDMGVTVKNLTPNSALPYFG